MKQDGWRNAREDRWDEGRKEGDQWVWIELTNMLHTSDLLYLYLPNDMTVLLLGFMLVQFFLLECLFLYIISVLMICCLISSWSYTPFKI